AGDALVAAPVTGASGDGAVATPSGIAINSGIMVLGADSGSTTITASSGAVSGEADVSVIGAVPPLSFASVSAGYDHTCAVTTDSSTYCWGQANYGQLGSGGTTRSPYATAVSGGIT